MNREFVEVDVKKMPQPGYGEAGGEISAKVVEIIDLSLGKEEGKDEVVSGIKQSIHEEEVLEEDIDLEKLKAALEEIKKFRPEVSPRLIVNNYQAFIPEVQEWLQFLANGKSSLEDMDNVRNILDLSTELKKALPSPIKKLYKFLFRHKNTLDLRGMYYVRRYAERVVAGLKRKK